MLPPNIIPYLSDHFRRGNVVLFSGAGFSFGAVNRAGGRLPLADDLKKLLWPLCFPSEPFDENSSLQDLFATARARNRTALRDLLQRTLSVDARTLPLYYETVFSLPWLRAYTLNIDDLAQAAGRQFALPRRIQPVSATTGGGRPPAFDPGRVFEVVHLNGVLDDAPEHVTFSVTDYAQRLASHEPLYLQCVADVLTRPVVYIGTPLDESPLWQHIELRRRGAMGGRELRRRSFLVSPSLSRARRDLLEREFNVEHVPLGIHEFVEQVLSQLGDSAARGLQALAHVSSTNEPLASIPRVSELAAASAPPRTEFLVGQQPQWCDLQSGRAIERTADRDLLDLCRSLLDLDGAKPVVLVTGTAGSGKSTSCMRAALALESNGISTGWIDSDADAGPRDIRRLMGEDGAPSCLFIDDADRFGSDTASLVGELTRERGSPLVVLAIRSGRADRVLGRLDVLDVKFQELVMPLLADEDIDALIDVLDRDNRLGTLKGKSRAEQVYAFRREAGRQLLVAMLQATSGRRFEERIVDEMEGLEGEGSAIYGLVAIATAMRFGLTREEVVLAQPTPSNVTLNSLDTLLRRHLVFHRAKGDLTVRHRVVGEVLLEAMGSDGRLRDILTRLAIAAATRVHAASSRNGALYRRIRSLMSHDWLRRMIGAQRAQILYSELEHLLHWDSHYWLQRGSLEVEHGDASLAENFLSQASALAPNDVLVQTELGYLRLRYAITASSLNEAERLFDEGRKLLDGSIAARGHTDPHPYQILGRQGLQWSRRRDVPAAIRRDLLRELLGVVEKGVRSHPRDEQLKSLRSDLQKEILAIP